jgi:hypothetical protein
MLIGSERQYRQRTAGLRKWPAAQDYFRFGQEAIAFLAGSRARDRFLAEGIRNDLEAAALLNEQTLEQIRGPNCPTMGHREAQMRNAGFEVVHEARNRAVERLRPGAKREPVLAAWGYTVGGRGAALDVYVGEFEHAPSARLGDDIDQRGLATLERFRPAPCVRRLAGIVLDHRDQRDGNKHRQQQQR